MRRPAASPRLVSLVPLADALPLPRGDLAQHEEAEHTREQAADDAGGDVAARDRADHEEDRDERARDRPLLRLHGLGRARLDALPEPAHRPTPTRWCRAACS